MTEQGPPMSPVDVAQQMREAADRMMKAWSAVAGAMTGAGGALPKMTGSTSRGDTGLPGPSGAEPGSLPSLPATFSAEKMQALLDDLAQRRREVRALRDSLTTFDEQLGLFEAGLRPMLEWTRSWAELEKSVSGFWGLPPRSRPES